MEKPIFLRSNYLYLFGLIVVVVALPLSLFLMSLGQFILAGAFFLEGNFIAKFRRFFQNRAAVAITGILLVHVVGMLWTTNTAEGWKDVRIKLPVLVLTVVMAGSEPLSRKHFRLVLGFFIGAVFAGTLVSMAVLAGIIPRSVMDIRDVFIFRISHIRFALFVCLAVFILLYFIFREKEKMKMGARILSGAMAVWLLAFLFIAESLTGLFVFASLLIAILASVAWKSKNRLLRVPLLIVVLLIPLLIFYSLRQAFEEYYKLRYTSIDLNAKTAFGNSYTFDLSSEEAENGYLVGVYVCENELRIAWNARSRMNFDSLDGKHQKLRATLIRFLASKGLRKDAEAVSQLTAKEVRSIEEGFTNVNYQSHSSISERLLQLVWEYDHFKRGDDPNHHSAMQRMEAWKASVEIIKNNFLSGVGTGDMPGAFAETYKALGSKLLPAHYIRSHNQYMAIAAAFGIAGLAYFLFALFYPLFELKQRRNYLYLLFLGIMLLSMLTEDTLETQAGATFFAFFNALFLFVKPKDLNA